MSFVDAAGTLQVSTAKVTLHFSQRRALQETQPLLRTAKSAKKQKSKQINKHPGILNHVLCTVLPELVVDDLVSGDLVQC